MRGTRAKLIRNYASEAGLTEQGYTKAMDGSIHCVGFRDLYKTYKKQYKQVKCGFPK